MVNGLWRSWAWLCLKRWRSNIYHSICAFANDFDTFETTEDRLTFLIHIPVHAGCGNKPATEKTTVITTKKTTEKIVRLMKSNPYITNKELAEVCGITEDGVYWNTKKLKKNNRIRRIGGDKGGYWEVIENGTEQ